MESPLGFGWFAALSYSRVREISADKGNFPGTFWEWEKHAQAQFDDLRGRGILIKKVLIEPDALLNWANGAIIDSNKRAEFAAMILMKESEACYKHI